MVPPFVQLFGIHAFIRSEEVLTQVPLAFVLMSWWQTIDYLELFNTLLRKLWQQPQVKRIVSDFEAAMWAAIRAVLPQIQTNNNTEGWHRRINARATSEGIQFYLLVPLLLREAKLVEMAMERVSDERLGRMQRAKQRTRQGEVFQIWEQYHQGDISAKQLIRAISRLE
ncbi:uncharacterized protein LOC121383594 [Gigantopelta aegis]|uniref:uncharacterized protein LOC121383594 n=1 Tax=Gigantopelta aegis TaxID=1735272 RepID=UPI001B88915D|nr:uncharacterized protein LOC121383594 [Gigantopelta aegis]